MIKVTQADRIINRLGHGGRNTIFRHEICRSLFSQEVATYLRIGVYVSHVVRIRGVVLNGERYRAIAIETNLIVSTQDGHLNQVINSSTVELLIDAVTSRAINMHLSGIAEAHRPQLIVGNLIYSILRDRDLDPLTSC